METHKISINYEIIGLHSNNNNDNVKDFATEAYSMSLNQITQNLRERDRKIWQQKTFSFFLGSIQCAKVSEMIFYVCCFTSNSTSHPFQQQQKKTNVIEIKMNIC